jgi:hypothetical protein
MNEMRLRKAVIFLCACLSLLVSTDSIREGSSGADRVSEEARLFYAMGYLDGRSSALPDLARLVGIPETDPRLSQLDAHVELAEVLRQLGDYYARKGNEGVPLRQALQIILPASVSTR